MIETERLILRRWRATDATPHRALVTHPAVVRTLGGPPPPEASTAAIGRHNELLDATGSCFWAVEHRECGEWIGWCGVKPGPAGTPIAQLPEIGWSLHPDWWGQGLATEAARAALARAWDIGHAQVWAITTPANRASRAVMARLGMDRVADADFDHPLLPVGDPLRRHLTFTIRRPR